MKSRRRGVAIAAAAALLGSSGGAWAQVEGPAVVPYRPSVATPADLPAPGWPELAATFLSVLLSLNLLLLVFNLLPQVERFEGRVRFSRHHGEGETPRNGEAGAEEVKAVVK